MDRKRFRGFSDWFYIVGGTAALLALALWSHRYIRWLAVTGLSVMVLILVLAVSGALLDQRQLDKKYGRLDRCRIKALPHNPADDGRFCQILYEPDIRPGFLVSALSQRSQGSFAPSAVSDHKINEQRWMVEFTVDGITNGIAISVSEGWVEYQELLLGINKAMMASGPQFHFWEEEDCIWLICLADSDKARLSKEGWQFA